MADSPNNILAPERAEQHSRWAIDQGASPEPSWPVVTCHGRLTLLIVGLLIAVIPTAYASPPDPSWISGYWDDDDFDYSAVSITGSCAIDVGDPIPAEPIFAPAIPVESAEPADWAPPLLTDVHPRGPPPPSSPAHA